ncbi:MAG: hypothetical protein B7X53_04430 [Hyphomonas sp. 34-62-18]|nr:MAG: hypothetical protein B7Z22_09090 [Hyphomonas sp. 32-62-5]OZB18059.1 MAG: hypothetical protein B7X53_04430 [Hyphomonas sp. 34-62-18]
MGPMGGYPPYAGFTEFAIALGVILSAIVSLLGTSSRKRMIALGEARLQDLSEMTGILDPKQLLAVFGPPDMGRVWRNVTLLDIRRARAPAGWLMSSDLVDYACILAALIGLAFDYWLVPLLLLGALGVQLAGWIVSARVPK